MKFLPYVNDYYSLSAQTTQDEVVQANCSFFQMQKGGHKETKPPGFRRKKMYSLLCYFDGYDFKIIGNGLTLSIGRRRQDGVKSVVAEILHRKDIANSRIVNILLTYDAKVRPRAGDGEWVGKGQGFSPCVMFFPGKQLCAHHAQLFGR